MKRSVLLSTMGLFLAINLSGQPAREVISINSGKDLSTLRTALPVPEGAVRSRAFDWNPRLRQLTASNEGDTLLLGFFDNRQYKAIIHRITTSYDGVLGITAKIEGFDFASCFITLSGAGISISADLPERDEQYRAAVKDRQTILAQYVLSATRVKEQASDIALPPPAKPSDQPRSVQMRSDVDLEAPVTIDVLVVYTSAARQKAMTIATDIDNLINLAFLRANYVLDNSQVGITLNMVHKYETNYEETGDIGVDLGALYAKDDGKLDEVHELRRQYRADLVVLVVEHHLVDYASGMAFLPNSDLFDNGSSSSETGFSVAVVNGSFGSTMIHEIGHNMGAGHHWQQNSGAGPGLFSYSSAYRGGMDTSVYWFQTVMSYAGAYFPDGRDSYEIPYFSNPDITVYGVRIGSVEKENNALTLKQTKHVISRYSEMLNPQNPFEVSSSGVLTRYNGVGGNVSIPADIGIKAIGTSAFRGNTGLLSVIVPSGVNTIEERAFENCTKLSKATLPSTLTLIGSSAFSGCTNLNQTFVNSATPPDAASNAFSGINLSSCNLIVPSDKKGVYQVAPVWKDFGIITEGYVAADFVIEKGVLVKYAGSDFSVTIPSEVSAIGDSAFCENRNIISVVISEGIVSIGNGAFYDCYNLAAISIPHSMTNIDIDAFRWGTGLISINVDENNPLYSSVDGVLFNKDKTTLLLYPRNNPAASYTVPSSVQAIEYGAFNNSFYVESIIIPNSVKKIPLHAFLSCENLKSVSLPHSLTYISPNAFSFCRNLPSITIPRFVTSIEFFAFNGCVGLKDVTVEWVNPISITDDVFANVDLSVATLHVPPGTKALYQAAPVWKNFGTIKEETSLGTEGIDVAVTVILRDHILYVSSPTAETVEVYSFSGTKLFSAKKEAGEAGFTVPASLKAVIVRGSSGWTRKQVEN